jgi:2-polyprenyl-3-methyl-5-hydroxy-6-metoxy-1,4-benzoquinol methylase
MSAEFSPKGGDGAQTCRFCGAALTQTLIDLGHQPLANAYRAMDDASVERSYPLHVRVCSACRLAQVGDVVPAEEIFAADYAYFSSTASSWVEHARRYAAAMTARFGLSPASQVIEVASNDGYLLQHFAEAGMPVLGIEPARGVAEAAMAKGIATEVAFFGRETAERVAATHGRADLIAANNVLAHVPDINDFVAGFAALLKPMGVVTVENPHLLNLLRHCQFDTIYHEHYSYLSLLSVERIFAAHGLAVFDVEELPTHGGSLRYFAAHAEASFEPGPGLTKIRADEAAAGLDTDAAYADFAPRVAAIRDGLLAWLDAEKAAQRIVAAYGAAAKGNTLLNFCGITAADGRIAYVCDKAASKQGKLLPGSAIPVLAPVAIQALRPDRVLILPWNLKHEIATDLDFIRGWGGRFAVAVPGMEEF